MRTPRTLSPYMLIQEFLRDEPWKLLVACIMLNQTRAKQVHGIINQFFDLYPTPEALLAGDGNEIRELIRPLGFYNRRTERLLKMSAGFIAGFKDVKELHGVGKYAADSHLIFCQGYLATDVTDKELRNYVKWAQEEGSRYHGPQRGDDGPGRVQPGLQAGPCEAHAAGG